MGWKENERFFRAVRRMGVGSWFARDWSDSSPLSAYFEIGLEPYLDGWVIR